MKMRCPHCQAWASMRTSRELSELSREQTFACRNVECGHTFTALTTIDRTLSPSAIPNPRVSLPLSRHVERNLISAVLTTAATADYTPRFPSARTIDLFGALEPRPG